jgi:hypothetical protein
MAEIAFNKILETPSPTQSHISFFAVRKSSHIEIKQVPSFHKQALK